MRWKTRLGREGGGGGLIQFVVIEGHFLAYLIEKLNRA